MLLIEEYGLNPEVMKVIINKIGALTTGEIKKLAELCEGPIKFALNNELKNRGLSVAPKRWDSAFEEFFIDESKFYEGVGSEGFRHDLESQQDKIPQLCPKTARQFCSSFIKNYAQEGTKDKPPRMSSLLRKLALKYTNAVLLISAAVQLLNTSNEQAANTRRYIKSVASQAIINGFFQILLQERLALPLIFFADWHYSTSTL